MKVAPHLCKRSVPGAAQALLLPSPEVEDLLALCGRLSLDPRGRIFAVAQGFLLKLAEPTTAAFPRTIRLRAATKNLYLPVDADLVPALLDDEAAGLVRARGLIFLPGGRVLGYAPDQPIALPQLLDVGPLHRRNWQPLPAPPPLADSLKEILLELPPQTPEEILQAGGGDIGTEAPQPDDAGPATKALGRATLTAGKGLFHLGRAFGIKKLAELGAKWMNRAVSMAPRLSESVLGKQEAALRELLRQFREGNLENALRRALPLGDSGDRGGVAASGTQLPFHNLLYSLGKILGNRPGPAAIWLGGYDVQRELAAEYRKAAEQAIQRGDYRRAAFIYGKLLRDYRSAAQVLAQGGLHHDAAVLFLDKVGDVLAAARAFEAAGEIDRALQLYRQKGEHLLAGDLLRHAGEEVAAIDEYHRAAEQLIASGQGFSAAGDLMLTRVGRADLALSYFEKGWSLRPQGNAAPCALKMAPLYAAEESPHRLMQLVSEAEEFFRPAGQEHSAGQFFNAVAELAERPNLAGMRDELRDRSLSGLALKLRQRAAVEERPGSVVSTLLGESSAWSAALVHDSKIALTAALKRPSPKTLHRMRATATTVRVHEGVVTAACFAPQTGEVFIGFHSGQIVSFRPMQNETVLLPYPRASQVLALSTDVTGQLVVALRFEEPTKRHLASYTRGGDGGFQLHATRTTDWIAWITPVMKQEGDSTWLGVWDGRDLQLLRGASMILMERLDCFADSEAPLMGLFLPCMRHTPGGFDIFMIDGDSVVLFGHNAGIQPAISIGWKPSPLPGAHIENLRISWWQAGPEQVELAGIGETGTLYWSSLLFSDHHLQLQSTNASAGDEPYLASTLLRSGFVAGITRSHIDWLRCGRQRFSLIASEKVDLPTAVACFPSAATNELIVVCGDGHVVRVSVPN